MRLSIIAAALALSAGVAVAASRQEPSDPKAPASAQPAPAQIVLASARDQPAAAAQPGTVPAKRRIARVTTCRCGDPQPVEDQQEQ